MNDVVDVVGVLSRVPELAAPHLAAARGAPGAEPRDAELAARPPTSQARRRGCARCLRRAVPQDAALQRPSSRPLQRPPAGRPATDCKPGVYCGVPVRG
jgi:hypothetical protein